MSECLVISFAFAANSTLRGARASFLHRVLSLLSFIFRGFLVRLIGLTLKDSFPSSQIVKYLICFFEGLTF